MAGSECRLCCVSGACYFYGFKLQGAVAFYFILVQNKHNSIKKKLHLNIDSKEKRTNRPALGSLPRDSQARWEMIDGTQEDLRAFCHISPFKIKIYRNELGTFFKKNKKAVVSKLGNDSSLSVVCPRSPWKAGRMVYHQCAKVAGSRDSIASSSA